MSVKYADFGLQKQTVTIDDRIKLTHLKRANSVFSIFITFKAGALYQPVDKPGLAHFVEHMLCSESKNYPTPSDLKKTLAQTAALTNAHTSPDLLSMSAIVPEENDVRQILDMMVDQLNLPMIADERINKERGAIQQEIRIKEKDISLRNYRNFICLLMNKKGDFIYPTVASVEQVSHLRKQDLLDYYEVLHQQKIYITTTGPMDISWLVDYFQDKLVIGKLKELKSNLVPEPQANAVIVSAKDKNNNAVIDFGRRIDLDDYIKNQATIRLMLHYLVGQKGVLLDELRYKKGLVYSIRFINFCTTQFGVIGLRTECSKENLSTVFGVLNEELTKIKNGQIDLNAFELLKPMFAKLFKIWLEKSNIVTEYFVDSNIGNIYDPVELVNAIEQVTPAEIAEVAKKYFQMSDMLWSFTGDLDENDLKSLGIQGEVLFA